MGVTVAVYPSASAQATAVRATVMANMVTTITVSGTIAISVHTIFATAITAQADTTNRVLSIITQVIRIDRAIITISPTVATKAGNFIDDIT